MRKVRVLGGAREDVVRGKGAEMGAVRPRPTDTIS